MIGMELHDHNPKKMCRDGITPQTCVLMFNHFMIATIMIFSMYQVSQGGENDYRDVFLNVLSLIIGVYIPSPSLRSSGSGAGSRRGGRSYITDSPSQMAERARSPSRGSVPRSLPNCPERAYPTTEQYTSDPVNVTPIVHRRVAAILSTL